MLENDNMPVLCMIKTLGATKRSKFIELRNRYIKNTVKENNIELRHNASENLKADMLTEPLDRVRYAILRSMVGVKNITVAGETILG